MMLQVRSPCSSVQRAAAAARPAVTRQRTCLHALSVSLTHAATGTHKSVPDMLHSSVAPVPATWSTRQHRPTRNVRTAARSTPSEPWWTKDNPPNMVEAHNVQEFVDMLADAQDKLVIVEFFATWCNACRSLFPKICKLIGENPDIVFIKVNFEDNRQLAKALGIKVLPFFHLYKGAEGRVAAFSCSISKIQVFKDALETHGGAFCNLQPFSGLAELPEVAPNVLHAHVPTGFAPILATDSMDATSTVYETLVSVDGSGDSLAMPASVLKGSASNGANAEAVSNGAAAAAVSNEGMSNGAAAAAASDGSLSNGAAAAAVQESVANGSVSSSSSSSDGSGGDGVKVPDAVPLEVLAGWRAAEVQGGNGASKQPGAEGQLAAV